MAGCYPVWEQSGLFTTKGRSAPHLCVWPSNSAAPTTCNHGSIRLQIWQSVATAWGWNQLKVYLLICLAVDSGCLVRPQLRLPHDLFIRPHNMAASEQSNFLNSISGLQKRMSQWQVHHLFWHSLCSRAVLLPLHSIHYNWLKSPLRIQGKRMRRVSRSNCQRTHRMGNTSVAIFVKCHLSQTYSITIYE